MTDSSPAPVPTGASDGPGAADAPGAAGAAQKGPLARYWWVAGLAIAGVIAALAATFASSDPDGLDSVAIQNGFAGAAKDPGFQLLPGYAIPGLDGPTSTLVAGVAGIAVVFLLVFLLGRLLARRRKGTAA